METLFKRSFKGRIIEKCEEEPKKLKNICVKYKSSIESMVTNRADKKIEELVTAKKEVVKKLQRKQYYLKKKNKE